MIYCMLDPGSALLEGACATTEATPKYRGQGFWVLGLRNPSRDDFHTRKNIYLENRSFRALEGVRQSLGQGSRTRPRVVPHGLLGVHSSRPTTREDAETREIYNHIRWLLELEEMVAPCAGLCLSCRQLTGYEVDWQRNNRRGQLIWGPPYDAVLLADRRCVAWDYYACLSCPVLSSWAENLKSPLVLEHGEAVELQRVLALVFNLSLFLWRFDRSRHTGCCGDFKSTTFIVLFKGSRRLAFRFVDECCGRSLSRHARNRGKATIQVTTTTCRLASHDVIM